MAAEKAEMYSALQVSRKIDYALRAMICIAEQPEGAVVSFRRIAKIEQVPKDFMAKILRQLVDSGIVVSTRGARGGYSLARPASEISFLEVIEAVDGPIVLNLCLGESACCPAACHCSMIDVWRRAQDAMLDVFRVTTIQDVVRQEGAMRPALPLEPPRRPALPPEAAQSPVDRLLAEATE